MGIFSKFFKKEAKTLPESVIENQIDLIRQNDQYYNEFHDENGNFRYPKFNSPPKALIKIKDRSDLAYLRSMLTPTEKRTLTTSEFFEYYDDILEFEVDELENILSRATVDQLYPYGFIKGKYKQLIDIIYEGEDAEEENRSLIIDTNFKKSMFKSGLIEEIEIKDLENYVELSTSNMTAKEVKEICEKLGLNSKATRDDCEKQIASLGYDRIKKYLPQLGHLSDKFDEFPKFVINLYLNDIKNSINEWHPRLIESVMETVKDNISESELTEMLDVKLTVKTSH